MRYAQETFLDPEEYAYSSRNGGLWGSRRRFGAINKKGKLVRGFCAIPDTYFTIPARIRVKGKNVLGYLTVGDGILQFHQSEKG